MSRFRVANGLEDEVARAFVERPRLVEDVPGFLGMEVLRGTDDPAVFHLLTRWSDEPSFRRWHRSDAHHVSHRGIPKGLKLDGSFTLIQTAERIPGSGASPIDEALAAALPALGRFLEGSDLLPAALVAGDGRVAWCNAAFADAAERRPDEVIGVLLADLLAADDGAGVAGWLAAEIGDRPERVILNLASSDGAVVSLDARLVAADGHLLVLGEPTVERDRALRTELLRLTNELAALGREHQRKLKELESSHWHLRKIQEVLPVCMECGKVKTSEARWDDVAAYLRDNDVFVSHGYCPDCGERWMEGLRRELGRVPG